LDDEAGLADVEWGRGNAYIFDDNFERAKEHFANSAEFYRRSGNEFGRGWALFEAAEVAMRTEDPVAAWGYLRDGLVLFAEQRDISAMVLFLGGATWIASQMGDVSRARRLAGAWHQLRITSGTDLATIEINQVPGYEFETLEALAGDEAEPYRDGKSMSLETAIEYALAGPTDS
jgi:hypothetical protein